MTTHQPIPTFDRTSFAVSYFPNLNSDSSTSSNISLRMGTSSSTSSEKSPISQFAQSSDRISSISSFDAWESHETASNYSTHISSRRPTLTENQPPQSPSSRGSTTSFNFSRKPRKSQSSKHDGIMRPPSRSTPVESRAPSFDIGRGDELNHCRARSDDHDNHSLASESPLRTSSQASGSSAHQILSPSSASPPRCPTDVHAPISRAIARLSPVAEQSGNARSATTSISGLMDVSTTSEKNPSPTLCEPTSSIGRQYTGQSNVVERVDPEGSEAGVQTWEDADSKSLHDSIYAQGYSRKSTGDLDDFLDLYTDQSARNSFAADHRRTISRPLSRVLFTRSSADLRTSIAELTDDAAARSHNSILPPQIHPRTSILKPRPRSSLNRASTITTNSPTARLSLTPDQVRKSQSQFTRVSTIPERAYRDHYGFEVQSPNVNLADYKEWETPYRARMERRRKRWQTMLKHEGISSDKPARFPTKSSKMKRFIRKGIPTEYRGAAWFFYSGAQQQMSRQPNLYGDLVRQLADGALGEEEQELIERDLHRTFPDNLKYKPEDASTLGDTPHLVALRRVLQAFALYFPRIGYCQSMNFIAGMLLLFMGEVRAFWLLHQITHSFLPSTHSTNLEGANIDLAVLMRAIQRYLPDVWSKFSAAQTPGEGSLMGEDDSDPTRLPTVSLVTTSWFMSLFVGTLPTESVLRVWDIFLYEGSKTLFRVALAIFKLGEVQIRGVIDPLDMLQTVQRFPRGLVDTQALLDVAMQKKGNGVGNVTQKQVDAWRRDRREMMAKSRLQDSRAQTAIGQEMGDPMARRAQTGELLFQQTPRKSKSRFLKPWSKQ